MLAVLIGVAAMDMLGFAMIFPLLTYYALDLDASPFGIGVLIASFSLAQLLASPFWGRFSDRYGRRPAILISLGASAVSFVIFGLSTSYLVLLVSRVVQGAGGGTTGVLHAYVSDAVPPEDRTRSLGWLSAATSAGTMIGPVLGSLASEGGRALPGLIAGGLCAINMVFAALWLRESSDAGEAARSMVRKPVWHAAGVVFRHPGRIVSRLVWIYGLGMLAFSSFTAVVTLYLEGTFGVEAAQIGYVFLYTGFLSVVLRSLLLGPIVGRFGETWTMRLGALSLITAFLGFAVAPDLWSFMAVMTFVPIGTALIFPSTTALTSKWCEKSELGTTMGTAQSFAGMARTLAPLVATSLFATAGRVVPFVGGAIIAGVVLVLSGRIEDAGGARPVAKPLEEEPAEAD
jgi:MFS family permease